MFRPASYDSELVKIYPYLEGWYIRKFNRQPDEDTIQEAMTRALEKWDQYDSTKCKLSTWVIRILFNVELARNKYYLQHHPAGSISRERTVEIPDNFDIHMIEKSFNCLKPHERKLLRLVSDGLKNREIASIYKNTPESMKTRVYNARRSFRKKLEVADYPIY